MSKKSLEKIFFFILLVFIFLFVGILNVTGAPNYEELVALYHLDNQESVGENENFVYDWSGNNNHGNVHGATWTLDGKYGGAFEFDGVNDYIDLGDNNNFKVPSKTISMWIKRGEYTSVFSFLFSAGHENYNIRIRDSGALYISWESATGAQHLLYEGGFSPLIDEWMHMAVTFDVNGNDVNVILYKNGEPIENEFVTDGYGNDYGTMFTIGSHGYEQFFFNGTIDEFVFFNRSLSAEEILEIYNQQIIFETCIDADNDGYYLYDATGCPMGDDCDDSNPNISPGATEICDGIDNNCDGNTDEEVLNIYYYDNDNDGYGNSLITIQACTTPTNYVLDNTDCNDNNPNINPGATEVCGNGIDEDCNGFDLSCILPSTTNIYVGGYETDTEFDTISDECFDIIRSKKYFSSSRSYGQNMLSGVRYYSIYVDPIKYNLSIEDYDTNNGEPIPDNAFETDDIVHSLCTLWPRKIRMVEFDDFVRNYFYDDINIGMLEVSSIHDSIFDYEDVVNNYTATLDALSEDFPNIKFVYFTQHLSANEDTGHVTNPEMSDTATNARQLLLDNYYGNVSIYDFYDLLSTRENTSSGEQCIRTENGYNYPDCICTFESNNLTYRRVCPEYIINNHPHADIIEQRLGRSLFVLWSKMLCGQQQCQDLDNDGYYLYDATNCTIGDDCDDNNANIHPNAIEICGNGIDEDCNGFDLSCGVEYTINLYQGWNTLWLLPKPVLESLSSLDGDYSVENVLESINNNYEIVYYHDGTSWLTYIPGATDNTLTIMNNENNFPYQIKMIQDDTLEI